MQYELVEKYVNPAAGTIVRCMSLPDITYQFEREETRFWRRTCGQHLREETLHPQRQSGARQSQRTLLPRYTCPPEKASGRCGGRCQGKPPPVRELHPPGRDRGRQGDTPCLQGTHIRNIGYKKVISSEVR